MTGFQTNLNRIHELQSFSELQRLQFSRVEFHFQPWNSTKGKIHLGRNVMEDDSQSWLEMWWKTSSENAILLYQNWQAFVELWPDSQVNQDARNARQGHLHMVTLAQEYLQNKLKLKDVHDVILIDWFVGFADHRCWFAWKWIPFGRVWFEGFECAVFFVDFYGR